MSSISFSPCPSYLSPGAFSYWKSNAEFSNLFTTGGSGKAISVFSWLIYLRGLQEPLDRMIKAKSIPEQVEIWETELRSHFLNKQWYTLSFYTKQLVPLAQDFHAKHVQVCLGCLGRTQATV